MHVKAAAGIYVSAFALTLVAQGGQTAGWRLSASPPFVTPRYEGD